jgi:ubiquinone/menaquinone biosynthesis C-methylase UbiE
MTPGEPNLADAQPPRLQFSDKYSQQHSEQYRDKHQAGLQRRLSNWWEQRMARKALALAGNPQSVLDLPCGAGRFWGLLAEEPGRKLFAADNSEGMVAVADRAHPPAIRERFQLFQTSAFAIDLPDGAVENIFCMRLLHHIGDAENRLKIYREFHRVAQQTVCLSLWVDGNYKAWRRKQLEARRTDKAYQNRFVLERAVAEGEFRDAGFDILGHVDFMPGYAMWRTYVLRRRP